MAAIDSMLDAMVPDVPFDQMTGDPNVDNSHALVPSSGFLSHAEESKPVPPPSESVESSNKTVRSLIQAEISEEEKRTIAKRVKQERKRKVALVGISLMGVLACILLGFVVSCRVKSNALKAKEREGLSDIATDSSSIVVVPEIDSRQKRGLGKSD
jgi:hypothetical protein